MRKSVHEVVRSFVETLEEFGAADLAAVLRAAGYTDLAARVLDDPGLVTTLVNEHAV